MVIDSHNIATPRFKQGQITRPQQLGDILQRISLSINKDHLHAKISHHLLGFIDELGLIIDPEKKLTHIRLTTHTRYYNLDVNRHCIEKLRTRLQQAGFIL